MDPAAPADTIEVSPARLAAWLGEQDAPQVVDVRENYERDAGRIGDSSHIELAALQERGAAEISRERPVVFYCRLGARSLMAAQAFRAAGYDAYTMSGGLLRWAQEGRPLEPDGGSVASH